MKKIDLFILTHILPLIDKYGVPLMILLVIDGLIKFNEELYNNNVELIPVTDVYRLTFIFVNILFSLLSTHFLMRATFYKSKLIIVCLVFTAFLTYYFSEVSIYVK